MRETSVRGNYIQGVTEGHRGRILSEFILVCNWQNVYWLVYRITAPYELFGLVVKWEGDHINMFRNRSQKIEKYVFIVLIGQTYVFCYIMLCWISPSLCLAWPKAHRMVQSVLGCFNVASQACWLFKGLLSMCSPQQTWSSPSHDRTSWYQLDCVCVCVLSQFKCFSASVLSLWNSCFICRVRLINCAVWCEGMTSNCTF